VPAADDPSVLRVLRAAVDAEPEDAQLRLHLAEVLLGAGRPDEALTECRVVIAANPDDGGAAALAARAAMAAGDDAMAERYERLAVALGVEPEQESSTDAVPERERLGVGAELDDEAAIDALIDEVFHDVAEPDVRLSDVGGLHEVKARLETTFFAPMRNPALRKAFGKSLRGGLLLYGPPGCGKTFLARAVAGELGARFVGVGLHDVLDMWLGNSEKQLHAIFESARRSTPCVLFFDEVDALGQKRSNLAHSAGRNVVVQLLAELDGLADNDGVFVLGATNQPWDVDAALRRPGRFDRTLLVLPPDEPARLIILGIHLRDRPVSDKVDLRRIANRTERYSGADLRLLCEAAAEHALGRSIESGRVEPISDLDLGLALDESSPSTGPWFEVARNYVLFANESGRYDDLLAYMNRHRLG
jgi:SpoVK/Ycf46/Vps4 family AAA+-type ATPase